MEPFAKVRILPPEPGRPTLLADLRSASPRPAVFARGATPRNPPVRHSPLAVLSAALLLLMGPPEPPGAALAVGGSVGGATSAGGAPGTPGVVLAAGGSVSCATSADGRCGRGCLACGGFAWACRTTLGRTPTARCPEPPGRYVSTVTRVPSGHDAPWGIDIGTAFLVKRSPGVGSTDIIPLSAGSAYRGVDRGQGSGITAPVASLQ